MVVNLLTFLFNGKISVKVFEKTGRGQMYPTLRKSIQSTIAIRQNVLHLSPSRQALLDLESHESISSDLKRGLVTRHTEQFPEG